MGLIRLQYGLCIKKRFKESSGTGDGELIARDRHQGGSPQGRGTGDRAQGIAYTRCQSQGTVKMVVRVVRGNTTENIIQNEENFWLQPPTKQTVAQSHGGVLGDVEPVVQATII